MKISVLLDPKLLFGKEESILVSLKRKNSKVNLNNFLNWFKFVSDRINIQMSRKQVLGGLSFVYLKKGRNYQNLYDF